MYLSSHDPGPGRFDPGVRQVWVFALLPVSIIRDKVMIAEPLGLGYLIEVGLAPATRKAVPYRLPDHYKKGVTEGR